MDQAFMKEKKILLLVYPVAEFLTALFALLLFQRKTHQLFATDVHP